MKPVVADYQYKTFCIRIVPLWGATIYITSNLNDLVMGANTYKAQSGYEFSGITAETSMSPGVLDLSGIADVAGISYDKVASGVFDGARVYAFATTWRNPIEDEEPLGLAILGKTTLKDDRYSIEMMMLIDALNQSVGKTYTPACQKAFGGQEFAGCMVDLGPITVTGTITHVTSGSILRDSARAEANDYFGAGVLSFTSGPNAGLRPIEIKAYTGGVIETFDTFHYPVTVGDAYSMIPGCRKRQADCSGKWVNIDNFGGFSFVPTQSTYSRVGGS